MIKEFVNSFWAMITVAYVLLLCAAFEMFFNPSAAILLMLLSFVFAFRATYLGRSK